MPYPKKGTKKSEEAAPPAETTAVNQTQQPAKEEQTVTRSAGDNPNKQKAVNRSDHSRTNVSSDTKPQIESVDPVASAISSVSVQGITDSRKPGEPYVGKIYLRIDSFTEISELISTVLEARVGLLHNRINLPPVNLMGQFLTSICTAFQMFQTLTLNSADGPFRKLRVLRSQALEVPNFLTPLLQSFGNYRTSEGLMRIAAIEQLIPMLLEDALERYSQIPGVRPLPAFEPLADEFAIYQSSNFKEDFMDVCELVHPEMFLPITLTFGNDEDNRIPIDFNIRTCNSVVGAALVATGRVGDEALRAKLTAYFRLRDLTWDEMGNAERAADLRALNFRHGQLRPIQDLADWIGIAIPEYQRVCYHAIPSMFQASYFSPSTGGTAAQLMRPGPVEGIDSAQTLHQYKLASSSVSFGYVLTPCYRVEYTPEYFTYGTYSRYQTMMHITEKFAQTTLQ